MSPKDLIIDFLNLIFIVLLVSFCILYFIAGDNFAVFTVFIKSMVPLAFFGIIFLVKLKIARKEIKRRSGAGNTEIVLYLNIFNKLMSDIIVFFTPILLGVLIYIVRNSLGAADIVLLIIVFLIMFFWQKYLFEKEK